MRLTRFHAALLACSTILASPTISLAQKTGPGGVEIPHWVIPLSIAATAILNPPATPLLPEAETLPPPLQQTTPVPGDAPQELPMAAAAALGPLGQILSVPPLQNATDAALHTAPLGVNNTAIGGAGAPASDDLMEEDTLATGGAAPAIAAPLYFTGPEGYVEAARALTYFPMVDALWPILGRNAFEPYAPPRSPFYTQMDRGYMHAAVNRVLEQGEKKVPLILRAQALINAIQYGLTPLDEGTRALRGLLDRFPAEFTDRQKEFKGLGVLYPNFRDVVPEDRRSELFANQREALSRWLDLFKAEQAASTTPAGSIQPFLNQLEAMVDEELIQPWHPYFLRAMRELRANNNFVTRIAWFETDDFTARSLGEIFRPNRRARALFFRALNLFDTVPDPLPGLLTLAGWKISHLEMDQDWVARGLVQLYVDSDAGMQDRVWKAMAHFATLPMSHPFISCDEANYAALFFAKLFCVGNAEQKAAVTRWIEESAKVESPHIQRTVAETLKAIIQDSPPEQKAEAQAMLDRFKASTTGEQNVAKIYHDTTETYRFRHLLGTA